MDAMAIPPYRGRRSGVATRLHWEGTQRIPESSRYMSQMIPRLTGAVFRIFYRSNEY